MGGGGNYVRTLKLITAKLPFEPLHAVYCEMNHDWNEMGFSIDLELNGILLFLPLFCHLRMVITTLHEYRVWF